MVLSRNKKSLKIGPKKRLKLEAVVTLTIVKFENILKGKRKNNRRREVWRRRLLMRST